ncbi:thioredoxin family protein [Halobacteria archaeon AArc-dxtr1]|nr:thioredoxin family protein [Halobacteria archaeon AArc-dxtr1]
MGPTTPKPTTVADGDALESFVADRDAALVFFHTAGCAKCRAMEPVLGNVARETGVPIGMVNPGNDLSLVSRFSIRSVPTLVCFREGEAVATLADGFQGTDAVLEFLAANAPETVSGGES